MISLKDLVLTLAAGVIYLNVGNFGLVVLAGLIVDFDQEHKRKTAHWVSIPCRSEHFAPVVLRLWNCESARVATGCDLHVPVLQMGDERVDGSDAVPIDVDRATG